jgi:hypothetical protein
VGVGIFRKKKTPRESIELPPQNSDMTRAYVPAAENNSDYVYVPPIDSREAICPNCQGALKKVPGSKTKCPLCGEFMFIRTDPHTRIRVVVTEAGAEQIDDEIAKLNGTWEDRLKEKKKIAKAKAELTKKFGGVEPSKEDLEWNLAIKDSIEYAKKHWWSSYALNQNKKAEMLLKRGKQKLALELFLQVAYLEHNGVQESEADAASRKMMAEIGFKEFDPDKANLPPYSMSDVKVLIKELNLNLDTVESLFVAEMKKLKLGKLPISPEESWKYIKTLL